MVNLYLPVYQVVQNAAARLLFDLPKRTSVRQHLRNLHWLPVKARVTFKALVTAHAVLYEYGPVCLRKCFQFYIPNRHLHSSNILMPTIPRFRLKRKGGSSLAYLAAVSWNSLPFGLRSLQNPILFRKKLKTFLFIFPFHLSWLSVLHGCLLFLLTCGLTPRHSSEKLCML